MTKLAHVSRYLGVLAASAVVLAVVKSFVCDIAVLPPGVSLDEAWWTVSFQLVAWFAFVTFCVLQVISVFHIFREGADNAHETLSMATIGTLASAAVALIFANVAVSCASDDRDAGLAHAETDADGRVITSAERDAVRALERVRERLDDDVVPAIARLAQERREAKARLRDLGVTSSVDLSKDNRSRAHAEDLAEIVGFLRVLRRKKTVLDRASFDLEALLRRVRQRKVVRDRGLGQTELAEVRTTVLRVDVELDDLAERVRDVDATDVDALVDAEMSR